jgi:hypothetical protein
MVGRVGENPIKASASRNFVAIAIYDQIIGIRIESGDGGPQELAEVALALPGVVCVFEPAAGMENADFRGVLGDFGFERGV